MAKGDPLPGFELGDCVPIQGDRVMGLVRWDGAGNSLRAARCRPVFVRLPPCNVIATSVNKKALTDRPISEIQNVVFQYFFLILAEPDYGPKRDPDGRPFGGRVILKLFGA